MAMPSPSRLTAPEGRERREHERVEIRRSATVLFDDGSVTFEGTAVDISRGGVAITCGHMPRAGERFGLKMTLTVDGQPVPLLATMVVRDVVHIGEPPYLRVGFQFTRFHSGTELSLMGFLSERLGYLQS